MALQEADPAPTGSTRIESRRQRSREHLIRAARLVFETHGYTRTSVERIIAEADVTRATFYRYFSSKDDVFSVLIDAVVDDLVLSADIANDELSIRTRLRVRFRALLETAARDRDLLRAIDESIRVNPEHAARWTRLRDVIASQHEAALAWCARQGLIELDDVAVVSRMLASMLESLLLDAGDHELDDLATVERLLTRIYWNSLFMPSSETDDITLGS